MRRDCCALGSIVLQCLYSVKVMGKIGLATNKHFSSSAAGLHSRLKGKLVKQVRGQRKHGLTFDRSVTCSTGSSLVLGRTNFVVTTSGEDSFCNCGFCRASFSMVLQASSLSFSAFASLQKEEEEGGRGDVIGFQRRGTGGLHLLFFLELPTTFLK